MQRLRAIRARQAPPEFPEADHQSASLYAELSAQPADAVARDSWRVSGELIEEVRLAGADDLLDPARHPWLRGQPALASDHRAGASGTRPGTSASTTGHHARSGRAVTVAEHAVATAAALDAPAPARGMASYNLACARAGAGLLEEAAAAVAEAIELNPDVRANAARDPDLASVRDQDLLSAALSG